MTKTPVAYKETLQGVLEVHEIERIIMDSLIKVQKYLFRNYHKLLYLLKNKFPVVTFQTVKRADFVRAVKIATDNGNLDQLIELMNSR